MADRRGWVPIDYRAIAKVVGAFAMIFSGTMSLPLVTGWLAGEDFAGTARGPLFGFAVAAGIGLVCGGLLVAWGRGAQAEFFRREGVLVVASVWILVGVLGAVPFFASGRFAGAADALFESVSGLTTTGSSVLGAGGNPAISELPPSLLFWRGWLHWLGGLGIVVMFLIFLPAMGIAEKTLFRVEVAGVSKDGLRPRIRHSANTLLRIYIAITLALIAGYTVFGMGLFDATCHAFATIATGGFSTRDASVGAFDNVGIEVVSIAGMFLAALNFGLYFRVAQLFKPAISRGGLVRWRGLPRLRDVAAVFTKDPEFRFYAAVVAGAVVLISASLWASGTFVVDTAGIGRDHDYGNLATCLRDGAFVTVSASSCCGYANADTLAWPVLAQFALVVLMISGACSGSTGGGLKAMRVLVLLKVVGRGLRRFLRPRAVEPVRVGGETLEAEAADRILALCVSWFTMLGLGTLLLLALARVDILSAFTSVVTCLSNVGPALTSLPIGAGGNATGVNVGTYGSFGTYPDGAKVMLSFFMILGRLELFAMLILLHPGFWRE